jgi:SAM-dependent methyltransferase
MASEPNLDTPAVVSTVLEENETLRTWNGLAQMYSERFFEVTLYHDSYQAFLDRLAINKKSGECLRVLDIGCGPGILGKYLLTHTEQRGLQLQLTGVDAAPNMIDIAQKLFPQCRWLVMDCRKLLHGLISEEERDTLEYEGVAVGFCIPYLTGEECKALLRDCHSLLQKHGSIYVSFVPSDCDKSEYKSSKSGQRVYFHYYEEEQVRNWLGEAGFGDIACIHVDFPRPNDEIEVHSIIIATKL